MSIINSKLDPLAQSILARPLLLKSIQATSIMTLGVVTGVAVSLYTWVIPIIRQAKTTRDKTTQFRTTVTLGATYLQPTSKILAFTMASLAYIFSRASDPLLRSRWKIYATAMAILAPVSPYEITMIFPMNYRMFDIDDEIKESGKDDFGDKRDGEVDGILTEWRKWQVGRILVPFVATSVLVGGALDMLPF